MEFFHPSFTRHGARDLKDIKRGNQLKSSKRQEMEELNEGADDNGSSSSGQSGTHKRMRIDYSIFRTDVARLQQNLDDLESDLKQHSMQVRAPLRPHLPTLLVPRSALARRSRPARALPCPPPTRAPLQVQEKLALILRALDEAPMGEEPSAGVAEAAHRLQNGLEPSVSPSSAGGLSSAPLQSGLQPSSTTASTGSLTPSTAAGSNMVTPSLGGGAGAGAGGGGGALGSSRDLAAAYLAAAGHQSPEEVACFGSGSSGGSAAGSAAALSQFGNQQQAIAAAAAATGLPAHFNAAVASSAITAGLAASHTATAGGNLTGLPGGLPGGGAGGAVGAPGAAPGGRWCDGWGAPQLNHGGATASATAPLPLSGGAPNSAAALAHQLTLQRAGLQGLYGSPPLDTQREPAAAQS